jgi:hypothetical protein
MLCVSGPVVCQETFPSERHTLECLLFGISGFSAGRGTARKAPRDAVTPTHPILRVLTQSRPRAAKKNLNDLHVYDPVAGAWTELSTTVSGAPPSPRDSGGFASAGGRLYAFGGSDDAGGTALSRVKDVK